MKEIEEIEQETAAADKRLNRFRQAVADIKQKNDERLKAIGVETFSELENIVKQLKLPSNKLDLLKNVFAEEGITDIQELEALLFKRKDEFFQKDQGTKAEKLKRVKFKL